MKETKKLFTRCCLLLLGLLLFFSCSAQKGNKNVAEPSKSHYRVIVCTDIGGTDPDDFQSMVHLLLYADTLDIEGLISSPFGPGIKEHIFKVIDQYEKDYPSLKAYSEKYPAPDSLRSVTKQGAIEVTGYAGFDKPTEGSEWIIKCARKEDSRPLYVLVWGGIEDLAQALHDAPDILPKLRVYYIGGPNKKWTPDAYHYIADNFSDLWIIESNATYRGWFTGGNQEGEWSNKGFSEKHIKDKGALGTFFMTQLGGSIKMGDTPSLAWLLNSPNPEDPTLPNWGGQYVRAWERPYYLFDKLPSESDSIQEFSILEIALSFEGDMTGKKEAHLIVENQSLPGYFSGDGKVRFRFSPKSAKIFDFKIESNINSLKGKTGSITAYIPSADLAGQLPVNFPYWWTDNPNPEFAEGEHIGAKTVSRWREEFLKDFARRMERCVKKGLPSLKVSENHRFLVDEKGNPFFWLGDTGWLLFTKLNREEVDHYLTDRAAKGFNVIQVMVLHSLNAKNAYGASALINMNLANPLVTEGNTFEEPVQYDYWDHLDYVIGKAADKGIYIGLVPVWGSSVKAGLVSSEQAEKYAEFLAKRYRNQSNIIWLNGGDVRGSDSIQVWQTIGKMLKKYAPGHLVTFHPFGRTQSSTWFHDEPWLDFNMFQSGHRRYDQDTARNEARYGEDNWRYVQTDYGKKPVKPTLDGEPSYEGIPQGLHDTLQPRWNDNDLRRYAYWSVFSGACGFTYGNNSVMQFYKPNGKPGSYGARQSWEQAINSPGAGQMGHLKNLMLKYQFSNLVPDQSLVANQGERYNYQAALRGEKCLMVYSYNGRSISLNQGKLTGAEFRFSWFCPRDGSLIDVRTLRKVEIAEFDPPGDPENGNDWVLILETND